MEKILRNAKSILEKLKAHPLATLWCYLPANIIGKLGYPLLVAPLRGYARSTVYNYHLKNGIPLKRLDERYPVREPHFGWVLQDVHNVGMEGIIYQREVSALEYYLVVFFIWGWLDDDSNEDTTDWGHMEKNFPDVVKDKTRPIFGNAFDLGDLRFLNPFFDKKMMWLWNWRNTAMNFKYLWLDY